MIRFKCNDIFPFTIAKGNIKHLIIKHLKNY